MPGVKGCEERGEGRVSFATILVDMTCMYNTIGLITNPG